MRVIYLGTPEFAVPTLNALIAASDFEVVAAVCQPDRPKGRGNKMQAPPVKLAALEHGVPVLQPEKLSRAPEIVQRMRDLNPDVIVMVAFGQILKKPVLEMAPHGVVNLHGSLLPKYRGAAPINWAIINGEEETGITTMKTDAGVDTGPMLLSKSIRITEEMTASELAHELAEIGAPLVLETLRKMARNDITPEVQNDAETSYAPLLSKTDGIIDWSKPAQQIHNLIRGLEPWPGTQTTFRDAPLKVIRSRMQHEKGDKMAPGTLIQEDKSLLVACGESGEERIELLTVQPQNKSRQDALAWSNGVRLTTGESLTSPLPADEETVKTS